MKHTAVVIFPHQLFEHHPALNSRSTVFLLEHPRFFTHFAFHKQKILLHRASMQAYQEMLQTKGHRVFYINYHQDHDFEALIKKNEISDLICTTLDDHYLEKKLKEFCHIHAISLQILESPAFLSDRKWLAQALPDQSHYLMNSFYIAQRKHFDILISHKKPTGGKWSYDFENRKKTPKNMSIPPIWQPREDNFIKEAKTYVNQNFSKNYGSIEEFIWPITHTQAKKSFENFLEHRLSRFGPYQDAIDPHNNFIFHSLLSSSLNNGLLTPDQVINATLEYAQEHRIPLNSLEGFIRQIIGWREFVRGIYLVKGEYQRSSNFFEHTRALPGSLWTGTTDIDPVDSTIKKIMQFSYAHHIERLMILGNFMLLCQTDPNQVYKWFMELFIDAYDWVMVPNVYGMSQYADAGLMTTKPYFSGSHYIRSMSTYQKGTWCEIWDALFWNFVYHHREYIKDNPRLAMTSMYLQKMSASKLKAHLNSATNFLNSW